MRKVKYKQELKCELIYDSEIIYSLLHTQLQLTHLTKTQGVSCMESMDRYVVILLHAADLVDFFVGKMC